MFVSVDLPMPGEPPSSTSEPGTRPPPSTRSSSPMPVCSRGTRSTATSRSGTGRAAAPAPPPPRPAAPPARGAGARSSTSVFHSPQPGQRPCHFALWAPHAEQLKIVAGLATTSSLGRGPVELAPAAGGPVSGRASLPGMRVRVVWWELDGSETTIEALREYVRDESVDAFSQVDGLRLKLWIADEDRNRWGAVYLWESEDASEQPLP